MIRYKETDLPVFANPRIPLGQIGVSYRLHRLFEAEIGDLVRFNCGDLKRCYMVWPSKNDMTKATNIVNTWIMLNPNTNVEFDYILDDLPENQNFPFYLDINGQYSLLCISKSMVDPKEVRISDQTRQMLGLSWNEVIPLNREEFIVKPILRVDQNHISRFPAIRNSVFIREEDLPKGWSAFRPPQVGSTEPFGMSEDDAVKAIKNLVGEDLSREMEAELTKTPSGASARIYYKALAKGVGKDKDPNKAISDAISNGLREELVNTRNRINATIDRIPK